MKETPAGTVNAQLTVFLEALLVLVVVKGSQVKITPGTDANLLGPL